MAKELSTNPEPAWCGFQQSFMKAVISLGDAECRKSGDCGLAATSLRDNSGPFVGQRRFLTAFPDNDEKRPIGGVRPLSALAAN